MTGMGAGQRQLALVIHPGDDGGYLQDSVLPGIEAGCLDVDDDGQIAPKPSSHEGLFMLLHGLSTIYARLSKRSLLYCPNLPTQAGRLFGYAGKP